DAVRVIDKMPGNFMHLGLIELLFPDARVIHCQRDSLDTCLSCYFQDFSRSHPYSYQLSNLGVFYKGYRRVMRHWKGLLTIPMMEVQYEDLVANQESVSRQLVDFCGLEWHEGCLQFHNTERFVGTASYDQVRQPMYNRSVGRWKNYEHHLGPLREALEGE
ncbi:MAG: sulfotransferase, partial [Gammaproteobacteria bacterium]